MELTPEAVRRHPLRRALRGYATDDVDRLIERVAAELGRVRDAHHVLEEQLRVTADQVAEAGRIASTVQEAEAVADRIVRQAETAAEQIRRDAVAEAGRVRADADADAAAIVEQAQQLARREVEAARGRVDQAAARHADVLAEVARHRDELQVQIDALTALTADPPPVARVDLVAGELPDGAEPPGSA